MKRFKMCFLLIVFLISAFAFSGCGSMEDGLVKNVPDSGKVVMQPMTKLEYTNKVDRLLIPLLNDAETMLGHHLDIVKDKYPISEEIVLVEQTMETTQDVIDEIDLLYPPANYTEHKAKTIVRLNAFKDSLRRYRTALESGSKDSINQAADLIKNEFATLKTTYGTYSQ